MSTHPVVVANAVARRRRGEERRVVPILTSEALCVAQQEIRGWPDCAKTPLHDLSGLAESLGVRAVWAKDEGRRGPLFSFKGLGGAYALREWIGRHGGKTGDASGVARRKVHATCASAGNHGRSVAWGARLFGARCTVYVASNVSADREAAIAEFGASTVRVEGTYDDAVAQCAKDAQAMRRAFIQDTSWDGYEECFLDIVSGYTLLAEEALSELPEPPTHVFLQVGCGGLAAAVVSVLWERYGMALPKIILVQSTKADPLLRSFTAGEMREDPGALDTQMTGIAVGELAHLAWRLLKQCGDFAVAIEDDTSLNAVATLAQGLDGDVRIATTLTGAAGLAALMACSSNETARGRLGLDRDSRVLAVVSERE